MYVYATIKKSRSCYFESESNLPKFKIKDLTNIN